MHVNPLHFGVNMYVLYQFGPTIVSIFGAGGFAALWVISHGACSAGSLWWESRSQEGRRGGPKTVQEIFAKSDGATGVQTGRGAVGASGALLGMNTALMCYAPALGVSIFPLPLSMPIWVANLAFASFSGYCMVNGLVPAISHSGHLGGMAGGVMAYYGVLRPWLRRARF